MVSFHNLAASCLICPIYPLLVVFVSAFHSPIFLSPANNNPCRRHQQHQHVFQASLEKEFISITNGNNDTQFSEPTASHTCNFCNSPFPSRSAIFRHLRADGCSSENPRSPGGDGSEAIVKQSIAISFGYVTSTSDQIKKDLDLDLPPFNEWAGQQVARAVEEAIAKYNHQHQQSSEGEDVLQQQQQQQVPLDFRLQESRTQSSVARHRSRILQQEPDCSAAGDVLLLTGSCLESSLPFLEDALSSLPGSEVTDRVRIHTCKMLASDVTMHAERSCTQLVYHYLVPLSWLSDGWNESPPTDSIARFKAALRSAESAMVSWSATEDVSGGDSQSNSNKREPKVATGRFGQLAAKERRAWHNFADPALQGEASPNQEPVWRCVDACKMIDTPKFGKPDACLVVEMKGDAFLPQQCRRIIGTALAVAYGWIHTIDDKQDLWGAFLLNPRCVMETIPAPANRLYLADTRFHYEESRNTGKPLFESDISGKMVGVHYATKSLKWTRRQLEQSLLKADTKQAEMEWLEQVRGEVAPRIQDSLIQLATLSCPIDPTTVAKLGQAPPEYDNVLGKLRVIVCEGRWPETSVARSSVISDIGKAADSNRGGAPGGSFTVVNTKLYDKISTGQESSTLPLANQQFPELAMAVFGLEEAIRQNARRAELDASGRVNLSAEFSNRRPESTHCAVNCNAQFTPHVDSGRGEGQSLSIIVGLGDYQKGELFIENVPCDIRYLPVEFNGWKLRHWTNQYAGERFSLVWFTPEAK